MAGLELDVVSTTSRLPTLGQAREEISREAHAHKSQHVLPTFESLKSLTGN